MPGRPVLTLGVLAPENAAGDASTQTLLASMTAESGTSSRTFKSADEYKAKKGAPSLDWCR